MELQKLPLEILQKIVDFHPAPWSLCNHALRILAVPTLFRVVIFRDISIDCLINIEAAFRQQSPSLGKLIDPRPYIESILVFGRLESINSAVFGAFEEKDGTASLDFVKQMCFSKRPAIIERVLEQYQMLDVGRRERNLVRRQLKPVKEAVGKLSEAKSIDAEAVTWELVQVFSYADIMLQIMVATFIRQCSNLKILCCFRCIEAQIAVQAAIRYCPRLTKLSLSDCQFNITPASIPDFRQLQRLIISIADPFSFKSQVDRNVIYSKLMAHSMPKSTSFTMTQYDNEFVIFPATLDLSIAEKFEFGITVDSITDSFEALVTPPTLIMASPALTSFTGLFKVVEKVDKYLAQLDHVGISDNVSVDKIISIISKCNILQQLQVNVRMSAATRQEELTRLMCGLPATLRILKVRPWAGTARWELGCEHLWAQGLNLPKLESLDLTYFYKDPFTWLRPAAFPTAMPNIMREAQQLKASFRALRLYCDSTGIREQDGEVSIEYLNILDRARLIYMDNDVASA